MADSADPTATPAPGGMKKSLPLIIAIVAGLAVGGASGAFFVGPAMAKGIAPTGAPVKVAASHDAEEGDDAAAADEGDGEGEHADEEPAEGEHGKEGTPATKPVHMLDNIVLNPAASGGTRFLLLSVAFEVKSAAVLEQMKARDAELRDVVLVTLGSKTVEELADMAARESLKTELRAAAEKVFKKGVKRVYFPQFVIQ